MQLQLQAVPLTPSLHLYTYTRICSCSCKLYPKPQALTYTHIHASCYPLYHRSRGSRILNHQPASVLPTVLQKSWLQASLDPQCASPQPLRHGKLQLEDGPDRDQQQQEEAGGGCLQPLPGVGVGGGHAITQLPLSSTFSASVGDWQPK